MEPAPGHEQSARGESVRADQGQEHRSERSAGPPRGAPKRPPHWIIPARVKSSSISLTRSWLLARSNGPRATRTTSLPPAVRGQSCLQASRSNRRARLRATAPPIRRPATHAAREGSPPGARYSITRLERCEEPARRTRRISRPERSLGGEPGPALRPSPGKDPASRPGPHPHPEPVRALAASVVGLEGPLHGRKRVTKSRREPSPQVTATVPSDAGFGRAVSRVYAPRNFSTGSPIRRPRFTSPPNCTPVEKGCG